MKRREEELAKEIVEVNYKLQVFKNRLNRAEEDCCKCGRTSSVVESPREPIAEDLDTLLREADEGRARKLHEGQDEVLIGLWCVANPG